MGIEFLVVRVQTKASFEDGFLRIWVLLWGWEVVLAEALREVSGCFVSSLSPAVCSGSNSELDSEVSGSAFLAVDSEHSHSLLLPTKASKPPTPPTPTPLPWASKASKA